MGTIIDDCSTDHYVTHAAARKYKFSGTDILLFVEGIGGKQESFKTKLYRVPVIDTDGNMVEYQCFGMQKIATADVPTKKSYTKICQDFGLSPSEVVKPREIDLLISARAICDHPTPIKKCGHLILYSSRFGKVLCGTSKDLQFINNLLTHPIDKVSQTLKTRTMRAALVSASKISSGKVKKRCMG